MRLHAEQRGAGPDLVLLHGWGMNAGVWAPLVESLETHWRLTLLELPGHGGSEWDPAADSLEIWAEAALAVAPGRAVWLGWSLGGLVALQVAAAAPQRVDALSLVASNPCFVQGAGWPHAMPPRVLAQFSEALVEQPGQTLERFLALQVKGGDDARTTLRWLRQELARRPEPQREALVTGLRLLANCDLRATLAGLGMPLLVLLGARDTLVPAAVAGDIGRLAPTAQVEVVAGAAHAPFLSHSAESLRLLEAFVGAGHD